METKTIEERIQGPQLTRGQKIRGYGLLGAVGAGILSLALSAGPLSKALIDSMDKQSAMKPYFSIQLNDKSGMYDNSVWQDFDGDGKYDFSIDWTSKNPEDAKFTYKKVNNDYFVTVEHPSREQVKSYTGSVQFRN